MIERGSAAGASAPARVVLSDDESLFRASLRQLLSVPASVIRDIYGVDVGAGFRVVGEAGSGEETVRVVRSTKPDLLVLDLAMPRMSGLDAVRELQSGHDNVRAILLTGRLENTDLLLAVQLGVRGLVLKHDKTELLFGAIMCVLSGGCWVGQTLLTTLMESVRPLIESAAGGGHLPWKLTARERQVLTMVAAGYANREIADRFAVSQETVKHCVTRLFAKVGASNRLELAMAANQHAAMLAPESLPS